MASLPAFHLIRATTVAEAIAVRRDHPGCRILAGGTDLLANMRRGLSPAETLVDITSVPELREIDADDREIRIGAAVTLAELTDDPRIRKAFPALAEAAASVAGPTHRASATLGGNLCLDTRCVFSNQSDWWRRSNDFCLKYAGTICHVAPTGNRCHAAFSGDVAPVLLVLLASVDIASPEGARSLPISNLYREDGAGHLSLAKDEVITAVRVPLAAGLRARYEKVRYRASLDFPLAGVAVALRREGDSLAELRIGVTGTNSRPFLFSGCEPLIGRPLDADALKQIDKLVQKQVSPMRTTIVPAHYRRRVAAALACRLAQAVYVGPAV